jgi:uncharacterized protein
MSEAADIRKRLRGSLTTAMRAKESAAVAALRSALSALANAEAVGDPSEPARGHAIELSRLGVGVGDVARRELSDGDVRAIVQAEIDERLRAAAQYERLGRAEQAHTLRSEAAVLIATIA